MNVSDSVVVIGGSNIDIQAVSALRRGDSVPGETYFSAGGVGRNVAENLARLGITVHLISVVGDDFFGNFLREYTEASGVDIHAVHTIAGRPTGCYLSLIDRDGEMRYAVSDMKIIDALNSALITRFYSLIAAASVVVIDANLLPPTIATIVQICPPTTFIVAEPVSVAKTAHLVSIIPHLNSITPNLLEAHALCAALNSSESDATSCAARVRAAQYARTLHAYGADEILITLGEDGVFHKTAEEERHYRSMPLSQSQKIAQGHQHASRTVRGTVTGAGDAFVAGLVYGHLRYLSGDRRISSAICNASIAIEAREAVNPALTPHRLEQLCDTYLNSTA